MTESQSKVYRFFEHLKNLRGVRYWKYKNYETLEQKKYKEEKKYYFYEDFIDEEENVVGLEYFLILEEYSAEEHKNIFINGIRKREKDLKKYLP